MQEEKEDLLSWVRKKPAFKVYIDLFTTSEWLAMGQTGFQAYCKSEAYSPKIGEKYLLKVSVLKNKMLLSESYRLDIFLKDAKLTWQEVTTIALGGTTSKNSELDHFSLDKEFELIQNSDLEKLIAKAIQENNHRFVLLCLLYLAEHRELENRIKLFGNSEGTDIEKFIYLFSSIDLSTQLEYVGVISQLIERKMEAKNIIQGLLITYAPVLKNLIRDFDQTNENLKIPEVDNKNDNFSFDQSTIQVTKNPVFGQKITGLLNCSLYKSVNPPNITNEKNDKENTSCCIF